MTLRTTYFFIIYLTFISCETQTPFDSEKWKKSGGEAILTTKRFLMTEDLLSSQILLGKNKEQLDSILGVPTKFRDQDSTKQFYLVQEAYTTNIDPDEIIFIQISFDENGISKNIELKKE